MLNLPIPEAPTAENPNALLVWALVVVVLALATSVVFLIRGYKKVETIESAVNNVGPGEGTISQRITEINNSVDKLITAHDRGWGSLPDDLDTSAHMTETIRDLQSKVAWLQLSCETMSQRIEHVDTKFEAWRTKNDI